MTGRSEPPDGPPENPAGGEDEYRSLVFDESFIQAARMREYSAQERMGDHARAVRTVPEEQPPVRGGGGSRDRHSPGRPDRPGLRRGRLHRIPQPVSPAGPRRAEPLRTTVIPLAPRGAVPGGSPEQLYRAEPVSGFRTGADGINLPAVKRTQNFSDSQITAALATVKDYLVESSLNPDVLTGSVRRPVEHLLDPDQRPQFERSLSDTADDGSHAATGWLVRFDPERVELADPQIRVQGTLRYEEEAAGVLGVVSDHTFTYALRPADGPPRKDGASLFTVRRELHFRLDREDLRLHRLEVRTALGPGRAAVLLGRRDRDAPPSPGRGEGGRPRPGRHRPVRLGPAHGGPVRDPGGRQPFDGPELPSSGS